MKTVAVIAPHPDDETLGAGGSLLKHAAAGDELHWIIVTSIGRKGGFSASQISRRDREIKKAKAAYGFKSVQELGFPTATLDSIPRQKIVQALGSALKTIRPQILYVPHGGDAHSDHRETFEAVAACAKWFRYPGIERVLAYETLSETEFGLDASRAFRPNVFSNIGKFLDRKIQIMKIYESEMGVFPFPRSERAIRALAQIRGSSSGFDAAESFMLLKEAL